MKKVLILLFTCLSLMQIAFAGDFVQVDYKTYVTINSYNGYLVNYWVKQLNNHDMLPVNHKKVAYKMFNNVVNCSNRTIASVSGYSYSINGYVLSSAEAPYLEYSAIVPNSIGEAEYNYVCSTLNNTDKIPRNDNAGTLLDNLPQY